MYDDEFFLLEAKVALESAEIVVPWVLGEIVVPWVLGETDACCVIDIGCGVGAWLNVAHDYWCDILGVDGHVPDDLLAIGPRHFVRADLSEGYDCQGYDLAFCLEVAEHLPPESAEPLVEGLAGAQTILFSAATPGQPGVGHINCRPHEYWHGLFEAHGKTAEYVGDKFDEPVADFYRRNMFLYR